TETFDFVTLTLSEFGCFHYEADNQRVLTEVARVLNSGGRFLLDIVVNRDELILNGDRNNSFDGGGFLIADKGSLDLLSGNYTRAFQWYQQGRRYETTWQIRAFTPPEVKRMLEKAGFQELSAYRNYAGDSLTRDSAGMVFLAQK
ncbi:MAG: class I SAM-dependent methyltransferase, partial [Caldilineaceae bacterium SB0675_bin_29]|nr:class I SAM-dependent methyltransferase [Caldilineaceae bacterium SB0675_bin_29]